MNSDSRRAGSDTLEQRPSASYPRVGPLVGGSNASGMQGGRCEDAEASESVINDKVRVINEAGHNECMHEPLPQCPSVLSVHVIPDHLCTTTKAILGEAAEATTPAKRVFLVLNTSIPAEEVLRLASAGISVHRIQQFGMSNTLPSVLADVKTLIRQGRVVWIYGAVRKIHWQRLSWVTQCCRLARRAGAQRSVWFSARPWTFKPYEMLRRHKYVQTHASEGYAGIWLA